MAVCDVDFPSVTVACSDHDPLQACAAAFVEGFVHDKWLVRRLAALTQRAGFRLGTFRSHGYADTTATGLLYAWVRRGADVLRTTGRIGPDLAEALKLGDRIAIMKDGKFVQVGTPEEVVAHPADDYVADFTRDVPRAHVLTVRSIMRSTNGDGEYAGDVAAATIVQDLLPRVVNEHRPYRVVDGDAQVGVVDRTAVLEAMIEAR